jgi:hypothetical protein
MEDKRIKRVVVPRQATFARLPREILMRAGSFLLGNRGDRATGRPGDRATGETPWRQHYVSLPSLGCCSVEMKVILAEFGG